MNIHTKHHQTAFGGQSQEENVTMTHCWKDNWAQHTRVFPHCQPERSFMETQILPSGRQELEFWSPLVPKSFTLDSKFPRMSINLQDITRFYSMYMHHYTSKESVRIHWKDSMPLYLAYSCSIGTSGCIHPNLPFLSKRRSLRVLGNLTIIRFAHTQRKEVQHFRMLTIPPFGQIRPHPFEHSSRHKIFCHGFSQHRCSTLLHEGLHHLHHLALNQALGKILSQNIKRSWSEHTSNTVAGLSWAKQTSPT